jgi:hypothetical protein
MNLDQIKDPRTRRRVQEALDAANGLKASLASQIPGPPCQDNPDPKTPRKRLRQRSTPKLNKLEQEAFLMVNQQHTDMTIRHHSVTFDLANGVRYTPDIVGIRKWAMICWEIKGPHSWDDAIVKLKVAASVWPDIKWILLWKENGQWHEQVILS